MITKDHKLAVQIIGEGYPLGKILVLECEEVGTGEKVPVICAHHSSEGMDEIIPVAKLFKGDFSLEINPPEGIKTFTRGDDGKPVEPH